ncbi:MULTISPECIES: hypothetical protein [unclassified Streptomyces]|uniref:hypothetical protein n=1 Tax=unclassified Streptomyces TaxID=2593676 RepID=UPI00380628C8
MRSSSFWLFFSSGLFSVLGFHVPALRSGSSSLRASSLRLFFVPGFFVPGFFVPGFFVPGFFVPGPFFGFRSSGSRRHPGSLV